MKPLLIVNPRSGGGRTGATFDKTRAVIERAVGESDAAITTGPRHAVELAREAALSGRETVIAVGGDGSIHEVVSGLMEARALGASGTRLGIIGQGTGGDFRKSLGLEHRLDRYCEAIAMGRTRLVDVGRFTAENHESEPLAGYFINILSTGLGGLVDRYVADLGTRLGGTAAYFLASTRALLENAIGVVACTFTLDGVTREEEIRSRSIAICNGRFFGSGMEVAPMARLEDGVFEVISLGAAPRVAFALAGTKMYSGTHMNDPQIKHFRCERMTMNLLQKDVATRFLLDVDGEALGRLPLTVDVMPQALEVIAP